MMISEANSEQGEVVVVNHPNRTAVTRELLAKSLVSVNRRFKEGSVDLFFDGSRNGLVPYFVVKWDGRTIWLTLD